MTRKLSELLPILKNHNQIMVTGPQRSGTTIASKILSEELNLFYIDEEYFSTHDVKVCFTVYDQIPKFVIQAPAMAAYCHLFPGTVIFMKRPIHEILMSQKRVNWPSFEEEREKAKYFLSEDPAVIPEIKYRIWSQYQSQLPDRFELDYHSMRHHRLWVPEHKRANFTIRQTASTTNSGFTSREPS